MCASTVLFETLLIKHVLYPAEIPVFKAQLAGPELLDADGLSSLCNCCDRCPPVFLLRFVVLLAARLATAGDETGLAELQVS